MHKNSITNQTYRIMKHYLLIAVALLCGTAAMAAAYTAPTAPTGVSSITSSTISEDEDASDLTLYYLLNQERGQFLTAGATLGTMATLDSTALNAFPYAFIKSTNGYQLYSPSANNNGYLFRNGVETVYTDYNSNSTSTIEWDVTYANGAWTIKTPAADAV